MLFHQCVRTPSHGPGSAWPGPARLGSADVPGEAKLSDYIFPEYRRENTPQPLWQKGVLDFRQEAPVAHVFSVYFREAVCSLIPKYSRITGVSRFRERGYAFFGLVLHFVSKIKMLHWHLLKYPKVLSLSLGKSRIADLLLLRATAFSYLTARNLKGALRKRSNFQQMTHGILSFSRTYPTIPLFPKTNDLL